MNKLVVGIDKRVELPPGGFLLIDENAHEHAGRRARIFEPTEHSFNPLKAMTPRKARDVATILYLLAPQNENTLTVRNGKRALARMLLCAQRLDKLPKPESPAEEEAIAAVEDVLFSPLLRRVLCSPADFSFKQGSKIVARIDRAELGDFDALCLGLFLMLQSQGQLVVPDFGFYGRDMHVSLIRQERLICGVNFLSELKRQELLRDAVMLIKDKVGEGCTYEDAETLALYSRYMRGTDGWSGFVKEAMG